MKQFQTPERRQFLVGWVAAFVLAATLFPTQADAEAKVRIAIWDFENNAEQRWWFWNDLGPAARNYIDTAFFEDPTLSAQFSVIEREKLDMVLQEQGSGHVGRSRSADCGQSREGPRDQVHCHGGSGQVCDQYDQGRIRWYRRQVHQGRGQH